MRYADARAAVLGPGSYFEVRDEDVRGTVMPVFRHRVRRLDDLLRRSALFGDRTYLVDGDVRLTFAEHLALVDAFAVSLQEDHGVKSGDRVALFAANRWEWVVAFWAVVAAGAVPCAFNGMWTEDEASYATALVEPVLIIGDVKRLGAVSSASGVAPPRVDLDLIPLAVESNRGAVPSPVQVGEDDPAVLIFTSGTTGRPKAVTTPHRALCGADQVNSCAETIAMVALAGASVPPDGGALPFRDDVVLVTSPLFHTSMLYGVVLRALARGSCFVLLPGRFEPDRVLETIEFERVTSWLALGSAAPRVCARAALARYDTSSVGHVGVGGAAVSPTVQDAIRSTFPNARRGLSIGYSSTEAVTVVANLSGKELEANPTSTGRAAVTVEIEVRGPDDEQVADGDLGEIHVRSPYLMLGYWNDREASAAVLKPGGWLAMGDLGRLVNGLLHIETRARDMILVNAENVAPTEVEHRLEAHDDVGEAAVFAVDDAFTGDAVCAVIVSDVDIDTDDLAAWCAEVLAPYKVPTRWHLVADPLPRTASGKLMKDDIRKKVSEETNA